MGIKSILVKPLAAYVEKQQLAWAKRPSETQQETFKQLLEKGKNTVFGLSHKLPQVKTLEDYRQAVPIRDYETMLPWLTRTQAGEGNILWPGKPLYLAKTSGTTAGTKYIPITKDSIGNHFTAARNSVLSYIYETGKTGFMDGKILYLSGTPSLTTQNGILTGRLSGIANHHVPSWLRGNQLPTLCINSIEDWETKIDAIVTESLSQKVGIVGGIPPWVQMYFDKVVQQTGKSVGDAFPSLTTLVSGGVSFEPYRNKLMDTIGRPVDVINTYPSSEGFFAYQDSQVHEGMLLLLNQGIFFEFIKTEDYGKESPTRLSIEEVEIGVNYVMVITSNAGLWSYANGDTIKFVNKAPYRIIVTGRIKHFTSAFGEHVIAEEVEAALSETLKYHPETEVVEFTVAPNVTPAEGLPHHQWYVEFAKMPANFPAFERRLDQQMAKLNVYYKDLIKGHVLEPLHITTVRTGTFINYMRSIGKLGGQNKVPRLANDRVLATALEKLQ